MWDVLVRLTDLSASMSRKIFCNFFNCNSIIVLLQHLTSSLTHENCCCFSFRFKDLTLKSEFRVLGSEFCILDSWICNRSVLGSGFWVSTSEINQFWFNHDISAIMHGFSVLIIAKSQLKELPIIIQN